MDCLTFWQNGFLILRACLMYSPRGLSAFPPPEERKPRTMSTVSSASLSLSAERSSCRISCCVRKGSGSWRIQTKENVLVMTNNSRHCITSNLGSHFLPYSSKGCSSVDILLVCHKRDVCKNKGLAMYEPIQDMFLQGLMVIGDVLPLPNGEGVVAVRQHNGEQLVFIVKEVTSMDMCDRHFVLSPEMWRLSV